MRGPDACSANFGGAGGEGIDGDGVDGDLVVAVFEAAEALMVAPAEFAAGDLDHRACYGQKREPRPGSGRLGSERATPVGIRYLCRTALRLRAPIPAGEALEGFRAMWRQHLGTTLLTGHLGQLATDFKTRIPAGELVLTEYENLDLANLDAVRRLVLEIRPRLILNCAAYNRVDEAEDRPEAAFAANAYGPRNLAVAARECGATLVHFSTDYVFDGPGRTPYVETDRPCPRSVYGISKLSGELMVQATCERHFIFRVCGLYGYAGSRDKGSNFVETMLALGAQGKPLKVVDDQILTPTSTIDVVEAVLPIIRTEQYGLYHLTAAGSCSWHEFARAIFEEAGLNVNLTPVDSTFYKTNAPRPAYSVLDNRAYRQAGFGELPPWRDGLRRYLQGRPAARRS